MMANNGTCINPPQPKRTLRDQCADIIQLACRLTDYSYNIRANISGVEPDTNNCKNNDHPVCLGEALMVIQNTLRTTEVILESIVTDL